MNRLTGAHIRKVDIIYQRSFSFYWGTPPPIIIPKTDTLMLGCPFGSILDVWIDWDIIFKEDTDI